MSDPASADRLDEIEADLETLARDLRTLGREFGGEDVGERLAALERRVTSVHAEGVRRSLEVEAQVAGLSARLRTLEDESRPATAGADQC